MSTLKKLASQTAIYGLSSIAARFLNYMLTPFLVLAFTKAQYGIITEMYAYVSFLVVFLTYGMETAFFRFYTRNEYHPKSVYYTIILTLLFTTGIYILCAFLFAQPVANWLHYPLHTEYVTWFATIVGLDAVSAIPFAKLRAQNKAMRFAIVNMLFILVNFGLTLFFITYCKPAYENGERNWLINTFYNPEIGVGYVFISNLIASIVRFTLLVPDMLIMGRKKDDEPVDESRADLPFRIFDPKLLKTLLWYAIPLLIAGLAGMVNETIDRIMLKRMLLPKLGEEQTMGIVGVYGGVYKISIIITLFIQAFRYAVEPFFFSEEKKTNAVNTYARVMNYFVMVCAVIYVLVMLFLHYFKYFTPNHDYWVALDIVPILLFANIFLGIYFNQSIWYKLTGKTIYGTVLALGGAVITLLINFYFIPEYTYHASAWATLICYFSMMIVSYALGQVFYPVPYKIFKTIFYLGSAFGICYLAQVLDLHGINRDVVHSFFLVSYICILYVVEFRLFKTSFQ